MAVRDLAHGLMDRFSLLPMSVADIVPGGLTGMDPGEDFGFLDVFFDPAVEWHMRSHLKMILAILAS